MKKAGLSILLVCYLAFSSGVLVNFHYCMDRLASTKFFAAKSEKCGKCGMNMHRAHGCCRDEVKMVKMEEDQKVNPVVVFELPSLEQTASVPSEFLLTSFYNIPVKNHYQDHSPPLLTEQDTYLRNSVFRI